MKKPEYVPYGEEWRKYMARLKKADVIRIASNALMQKESERQEMIDALKESTKMLKRILEKDSIKLQNHHIRDIQDQIISNETALRNAGVTEE